MLLFAPCLQNPDSPTLFEAVLWVQGDELRYVGPRSELPAAAELDPKRITLRDCVVAPGLVNAHCHLEYTSLANLPYPGSFTGWIRSILEQKNALSPGEQQRSLEKGVLKSIWGGTSCVGDHVSVGNDLTALLSSALRGKIFLELLGLVPEVAEHIFALGREIEQNAGQLNANFELILSPHSVHAVNSDILAAALHAPASLFSIHLAESAEEMEYFARQSGPLHAFITERGQKLPPLPTRPLEALKKLGALNEKLLVVHGNYLTNDELAALSRAGASLVYCPFSQDYFGHRLPELPRMLALGLNVALGSDSLSSAATLSMLEIIRKTRDNFPELSLNQIFRLATLGGARALKMEAQAGSLEAGKKADVIAVPWKSGMDPLEAIFNVNQVEFSMIGGELCLQQDAN